MLKIIFKLHQSLLLLRNKTSSIRFYNKNYMKLYYTYRIVVVYSLLHYSQKPKIQHRNRKALSQTVRFDEFSISIPNAEHKASINFYQ